MAAQEQTDGPPPRQPIFREVWGDVTVAIAMLAVAAAFYFGADAIETPQATEIGPRAYPKACSLALAIAAAALLAGAIVRVTKSELGETIAFPRFGAVAIAALITGVVAVTLEDLGFNLVIGVWVLVMCLLGGVRSPLMLVALCGGYLLFAKVVFQLLLKTPLP
ncbi:MAG: hypothetical protein GEU95_18460 [Rhizobiales bacterium]|nr:hypothetical protein [Hyphomicrobiales bacterium]